MEIVAPIRDLTPSRSQQVEDLQRLGMPVPKHGAAYSINSGLWGVTIGGTETTTSDGQVPEHAWVRTQGAYANPKAPTKITLTFKEGQPTHVDGVAMEPVALIEHVDTLAASYGIGRGVHLGDTVLGVKGRVAFEAPAATVLIESHRELEKLVLTGRQQAMKDAAARNYGDWLHEGHFLDPACRDIEALLTQSQTRVSGEVVVTLRTGSLFVEGVSSPYSLMAASRSTYGEAAKDWTPTDAAGFSRLVALPSILAARAGARAQS
jgi:argininosuccinate synthase